MHGCAAPSHTRCDAAPIWHSVTPPPPPAPQSGRTHWVSCARARRELGYSPRRHAWRPVVDWFIARGHGRGPAVERRRRQLQQQAQEQEAAQDGGLGARRRSGRWAAQQHWQAGGHAASPTRGRRRGAANTQA